MDHRHRPAALQFFLRQCNKPSTLANGEIALLAVLFLAALLSRVWNLTNFPDNIYPDEIMTGTVATQSYQIQQLHRRRSLARCGAELICLLCGSGLWPYF